MVVFDPCPLVGPLNMLNMPKSASALLFDSLFPRTNSTDRHAAPLNVRARRCRTATIITIITIFIIKTRLWLER